MMSVRAVFDGALVEHSDGRQGLPAAAPDQGVQPVG